MSVIKCKMCGGDLELIEGSSVAVCEYCGSQQTVPAADNEKKLTLFARANRLRLACEFDKAAGVYESIVADFPTEAEAYWGLVLCRYGIEYVDDPATGKKIPTCHRSSFDSVMEDSDFEQALENADAVARRIYRDEAKAIEELRRGIVEVSGKEPPYDIFICYKETAEDGQRTVDSVIAQDVYDALTEKGYRVFFSRISLEDKLGTEYEPYIFAALHSAKIMLAFGTDYEYYNAVWVKNEWSRYLQLMTKDKSKHLIPCYKGIDAYDMPKEFAKLQAQDMGKVGAMQDLLRGVDKIMGRDKAASAPTVTGTAAASATVESLLKRAEMFLEDGDWDSADEYCEKVLDITPENAQAYLYKLMVELEVSHIDELQDCDFPFNDRDSYHKVMRFGDDKLKERLAAAIEHINVRMENERKDATYEAARYKMRGEDASTYGEAIALFQSIIEWEDAEEQIRICQKKIDEIEAKKEAEQLEIEQKAEEKRIADEAKAKKYKKIITITTPIACAVIAIFIILTKVIIPHSRYNSAMALIDSGKFAEAYAKLIALDGYKDSQEKAASIYAQYEIEKIKSAKIGDTITFGTYEQDNDTANGKEDIEWLVLAKEGKKALLISDKAIDCKTYHSSDVGVTWGKCTLRTWMNGTFLKEAFTVEEQAQIQSTEVSAEKNPDFSTDPGNSTTDRVFLLSISEAKKYFGSDKERICFPTVYTEKNSPYMRKVDEGTCWWWLRTPASDQNYAATVFYDGVIYSDGINVDLTGGIRPAMWVSFE